MPITLTDEQATDLATKIRDLMHCWNPDSQRADYMCEFCGRTSDTNQGSVTHLEDCDGPRYLAWLEAPSSISDAPISAFERFTLVHERITNVVDAPGYRIVLLDGENQVGLEDGGSMIFDVSDKQLLENCELSEEDAAYVQKSAPGVTVWLASLGIPVLSED